MLLEKNAIIPDELDIMWDAQKEKHDAVQRNFHDLIAKLASAFNNQLQERLFARMKAIYTMCYAHFFGRGGVERDGKFI